MTDAVTHSSAEPFEVFGHSYPARPGPISEAWRTAAATSGYTLLGRVRDDTTCVVECDRCRELMLVAIHEVTGGLPPCPSCREMRRLDAAARFPGQIVAFDPAAPDGAVVQRTCGHHQYLSQKAISAASEGKHLPCPGCREAAYADISRRDGWYLKGIAQSGDPSERSYRQDRTGAERDMTPYEVYWQRYDRLPRSRARHECPAVYAFEVHLLSGPAIKVGASANPARRLIDLGLTRPFNPHTDHVAPMPRADVALREEQRLHAMLLTGHPDLVVPAEEIGTALTCSSEVYRMSARDLIHAELDKIASRYRGYDGRSGLMAPAG